MAKDIAQRQLDQAGFRISNLGDPTTAGDATKTDNTTVPKPASGTGSAGTSFLAAPADHVHPAPAGYCGPGGSAFYVDDPTMQEVRNEAALIWESAVNFAELPGDKASFTLSAFVQAIKGTGGLELRVGGDPGQTDGTSILTLTTSSPSFELKVVSAEVSKPLNPLPVKLIASAPAADAVMRVRGKTINVRGVGNAS